MRVASAFLIIILLSSFTHGEPVATLICKNANGKVVFEAILPSCKYLETGTYKKGRNPIHFIMDDQTSILFKPEQKQFSIRIISQSNGDVQLSGDSKIFKVIKNEKGPGTQFERVYSFKATFKTSLNSHKCCRVC